MTSRQPWWDFVTKYQKSLAFMPFYGDFLAKNFQWVNDTPPQEYTEEQAEQ